METNVAGTKRKNAARTGVESPGILPEHSDYLHGFPSAAMTEYARPVCRGSWVLGTACGKCERCAETRQSVPDAICGYPLPGWRLRKIEWVATNGWIVALEREGSGDYAQRRRIVMAQSALGLLEAWDETLQIALGEDAQGMETAKPPRREPGSARKGNGPVTK